jgi:hypothetical protein
MAVCLPCTLQLILCKQLLGWELEILTTMFATVKIKLELHAIGFFSATVKPRLSSPGNAELHFMCLLCGSELSNPASKVSILIIQGV